MVSVEGLKNEVKELKSRVNPEGKHFAIHSSIGGLDTPHSYLHVNILHIVIDGHGKETQWVEADNAETELIELKEYYDKMFGQYKFMKDSNHPYSTFEKFLESQTCKCGKHGLDGKQPYLGECH